MESLDKDSKKNQDNDPESAGAGISYSSNESNQPNENDSADSDTSDQRDTEQQEDNGNQTPPAAIPGDVDPSDAPPFEQSWDDQEKYRAD